MKIRKANRILILSTILAGLSGSQWLSQATEGTSPASEWSEGSQGLTRAQEIVDEAKETSDGMLLVNAILGKNDAEVSRLVGLVGNLNFRGLVLDTPLMAAIKEKRMDYVHLLINRGANAARPPGRTEDSPLLVATIYLPTPELIGLLLDRGADPNDRWGGGDTALITLAHDLHNIEAVRVLLERPHGADPNLPSTSCRRIPCRGPEDYSGYTALMEAAYWAHGLDAEFAGNDKSAMVQLLLDHGAAVNAQNTTGSTALMCAAGNGNANAANLLLSRRADRSLRNSLGETAADIARSNGHTELAKRLEAQPKK